MIKLGSRLTVSKGKGEVLKVPYFLSAAGGRHLRSLASLGSLQSTHLNSGGPSLWVSRLTCVSGTFRVSSYSSGSVKTKVLQGEVNKILRK